MHNRKNLGSIGRRWGVIVTVCAAQFLAFFIFQVVTIILPAIGGGLAASPEALAWVAIVFPLAFGGLLLPAGRLADAAGHRHIFIAGLAVFAIASLVCGLAPNIAVLIGARAAQGAGVALFTPAALALLFVAAKGGAGSGAVLAAWGVAGPIGGVVGLLAGTAVTEQIGWRGVFLGVVPVTLLPLLLALAYIPAPSGRRRHVGAGGPSVLTGVGAIVALTFSLNRLPTGDVLAVPLLLVAGGLLVAFVVVDRRVAEPLLPLALLRRPGLAGADIVAFLHGASGNSFVFFYALFVQEVIGFSPFAAGLGFLPSNGAVALGSTIGGRVVKRVGLRFLAVAGMATMAGGLLLLSFFSTASGGYVVTLLPGLVVLGFGYGLAQIGVVGGGTLTAPESEHGLAGGLLTTSGQVGSAVGLAALVALVGTTVTVTVGGNPSATADGFRVACLGAAGLATVGALVAAFTVTTSNRE